MKPDFYTSSKKSNIYNSIYIYKIISIVVLTILTVVLAVLFSKDKALFHELSNASTPAFFIAVAVCLILFSISIIIDLWILNKTASIGRHLNKLAFIDHLTGLPNRYSCDLMFQNFDTPEHMKNIGCVLMMLDSLKDVNDTHGHETGNHLMADFSDLLSRTGSPYGFVGRNGGNEFLLIIEDCDNSKIDLFLLDFAKNTAAYNEKHPDTPIRISYTSLQNPAAGTDRFFEFITLVYKNFRTNAQKLL